MNQTEAAVLLEKEAEQELQKLVPEESAGANEKAGSSAFEKFKTWIPSAVIVVFWFVIGYIRTAGVQLAIFKVLSFFTGAMMGISQNTIGGIIGKALLLMCVNALFRDMFLTRGSAKEKFQVFVGSVKDGALELIPMFTEITEIVKMKKAGQLAAALIGIGAAVAVYPFITGTGAFQNSFVVLLLAVVIFRQFKDNTGLINVLMHWILKLLKVKDRSICDAAVTGISCGFAGSLLIALTGSIPVVGRFIRIALSVLIPVALIALGVMTLSKVSKKKEVQ